MSARSLFQVLGLLLTYPTPELLAGTAELMALVEQDATLSEERKAGVLRHCMALQQESQFSLQERYVAFFDRTRGLSLHLFEHVHGESKDRGQAMVELAQAYAASGFAVAARELPDFVPVVCEFLSVAPVEIADKLLADILPLLERLQLRLSAKNSSYAEVFAALVSLHGEARSASVFDEVAPVEPTFAEVDELWAEQPITFGVAAAMDSAPEGIVSLRRGPKGPALQAVERPLEVDAV